MNVARPMDESLTNALSHVIYRVATAADLPAMAALPRDGRAACA
ncbi:MAG: hypothetical protein AB7P33_18510 [Dehalococcoidia bacterium]